MTERERQLEVEAEEYLRENLGKRPTEEIIKYLIGAKKEEIRRLEKEGGEIPGTELISFGDDQYVEITNLSISLLNRLQTETGFHKSEIIEKALEKFVISRYTEDIDNKLENRPDAPVSSNTRFENSIPKNKLESGYKRAIPKQNDEHSIMVKGLIPMLQNKIFPVIFVIGTLKDITNDEKPWISLDYFREYVGERAKQLVQRLDATPNVDLQVGFPASENKIERALKKSWSGSRKNEERIERRKQTMMRFLNTFVGTIEEDRKLDRHVLEGAPGEWGMIDGGVESDGKEWIKLTQKGKEMAGYYDGPETALRKLLNLEPEITQRFHYNTAGIEQLFENIFKNFPLEYEAMIMMLKKGEFGGKIMPKLEKEQAGSDELKMEFYKVQKKYLQNKSVQKESNKEIDWNNHIEKLEEDDYLIPKIRSNAVMNKLKELGLFVLENRKVYKITDFGKDFLQTIE